MRLPSLVLTAAVALVLSACGSGGDSGANDSSMTPSPSAVANSPPTFSAVEKQSIAQDAVSNPITFEVSDAPADLAALTVAATSSNSELLGGDALVLAGNAGSRSITLTPTPGMSGTATVTLIATDPQGSSSQRTFDVTVTSEQRSFREMVGTVYSQETETEGEQIVGYHWVDRAEEDDTAFDHLLAE